MAQLRKEFITQPTALVNYDYTDIIAGTGVINFKGAKVNLSGSSTYELTTNDIFSNYHYSYAAAINGISTKSAAINSGTEATYITANFDTVPFNTPRIVSGRAVLNLPISGVTGHAGGSMSLHWEVYVQHYDGVNPATTIGYSESTPLNFGGLIKYQGVLAIPITLTQKSFKKGDMVRLSILMKGTGNAYNNYGAIAHDPKGRFDGDLFLSGSTILNFYCPFKLDL